MPKNTLIDGVLKEEKLWCLEVTKKSRVTRIWAALKTCEELKKVVGGEIKNTPIPGSS